MVEGVFHPLTIGTLGREWGHDVVSETTRLIVVHNQDCAVPVLALHQRVDNVALDPSSIVRRVRGMLRQLNRRNDVRYLGETAVFEVEHELVQTRAVDTLLGQRTLLDNVVLVLLELFKHVMIAIVGILVHEPRNVLLLQVLRDRLPLQRKASNGVSARVLLTASGTVVIHHRTTLLGGFTTGSRARRVDRTRQPNSTVGVRGRGDTLMVRVTHDELFSQGKVHRKLLALIVTKRVWGVVQRPTIVLAIVPGSVVFFPAIRATHHALSRVRVVATSLADVEVHQLLHVLRRGRLDGRVHRLRED